MRPLAAPRAVGNWILFGVLIGFSSCTSSISISPGMTYSGDWSTPLPAGVSSNPGTFRSDTVGFLAGPVVEQLRAGANCNGCSVTVRVRTIGNTRSVDPALPPNPGRRFAHITNLDPTNVEAYYGFKPESQADYYLWIGPRQDRPDSALITILEVPKAPAGLVRAGAQKKLELCHAEPHGAKPLMGVDFLEYKHPNGCDNPVMTGQRKVGAASLLSATGFLRFLGRTASALGLKPLTTSRAAWIDCNSGCCT